MSRLPRPLARRIDRLAARAHAFHRHAHHPLCGAYAGEVIRLGRRARACRGCALAALGALAGAGLALAAPPLAAGAVWAGVAAFAAAALLALRLPLRARRPPKWATRALPMALGAAAATAGLRMGSAAGVAAALAALAAFGLAVRAYRRRGPDRRPCGGCPEAAGPGVCSGLAPVLRRERAFRRLAGAWIRGA